jgi:dTDP-4-dehydrorhamnose 3,5-epimerase
MLSKDVILINGNRHEDSRGYFSEIYRRSKFFDAGISSNFVQDNLSLSNEPGTIRGLHYQSPPHAQAKLVRCISGSIFDVAVDIREDSKTFGHWIGFTLTENNGDQLFIPEGFAHGFMTLTRNCLVLYKCSNYYDPKSEGSIIWNDPDIGVEWPSDCFSAISPKDESAPRLKDIQTPFLLSGPKKA